LKAPRAGHEKSRPAAIRFDSSSHAWLGGVGLAVAIGFAYFMAARLGLALRAKPEGVAIFWPAAGIAVGALIVLGPSARLPVAVAVAVATIASNLLIARNPWLAVTFGLVNAGQTLLTAWLIERRFGNEFRLDGVAQVLGLLVATAIGAALAAIGAAVAVGLVQPAASSLNAWRLWFASCSLGIVTVAPLLIGLCEVKRERLPRHELIEGAVALTTLVVLSVLVTSLPQAPWATALPVALVFPVLLWIAVRCRPVFAAAAAFIVALVVVWSITFSFGHFGDASTDLADRILSAQTLVLGAAFLVLVLAALFAERRRNESILRISNERLQLALGGAKLGAFSVNLDTGGLECDARAAQIHGHNEPPKTLKEGRCFVHPDDRVLVDAAFAEAQRRGGVWNAEYRVVHPPGHPNAGEFRWVAFEGSIVRSGKDVPVRLLGVTRDITEHKHAEQRLHKQVETERRVLAQISAGAPLAHVLDELLRAVEERSDIEMMASVLILDKDGKHLLHGATPSLPQAYSDAIHGAAIGPAAGSCGTAAFRGEPVIVTDIADDPLWVDYRDLAKTHGLRACWSTPIKAVNGRVLGTFAIYYHEPRGPTQQDLDSVALVTHTVALAIERHLSEQALRESRDRLSCALDAAGMVGTWDWCIPSDTVYCDAQLAALCSVDPKKGEEGAPLSFFFEAVHPEDIGRLQAAIQHAIATGEKYSQGCRMIQKDGSVRWVIARGQCFYDRQGKPRRFPGVVVDVTECREAEFALKQSEARLQQALAAGHVMAFEWDSSTGLSQRSENTPQILGIESRQLSYGQGNDFLARVHPDDRADFSAHVYGVSPNSPTYSTKFRFVRPDGQALWLEETAKAEFDAAGRVVRLKGLTRDVTEFQRGEERQSLLVAELDHRVKNTLACVSVIAQRSRDGRPSMDEFLEALDGRIQSMANTQALLSRGCWQGASLAALVECELAPCVGKDNATVEGPDVVLTAEAAQAVATVLHELVTNAAKYGALSTHHGRVSVCWDWRSTRNSHGQLRLVWQENGGPPVVTPKRSGYGTSVIRNLIPYEIGGTVNLVFAPQGVRCELILPGHWLRTSTACRDALDRSESRLPHHRKPSPSRRTLT